MQIHRLGRGFDTVLTFTNYGCKESLEPIFRPLAPLGRLKVAFV